MTVGLKPLIPPLSPAVSVTLNGGSLAEPLGHALRAQWSFGFPLVPKPGLQLTHGFLHYPAGMQAVAAQHLLEVLPPGVLLDPFVGGGTTLIEGLRSGRQPIGADASPLALFATAHHTWLATDDDIKDLRAQATEAIRICDESFAREREEPPDHNVGLKAEDGASADADGAEYTPTSRTVPRLDRTGKGKTNWKMWEPLKAEIERLTAASGDIDALDADDGATPSALASAGAPALTPLWFCFAAAQQRSERYRYRSPLASFDATVESFCLAMHELRAEMPSAVLRSGAPPRLLLRDARELSLAAEGLGRADGLITSPPYAGVYDYLSHAREARAKLGAQGAAPLMGLRGTPQGRDWPTTWRSTREMGARKAMQRTAATFKEAWEADQRAWLTAARANLRAGGRAALLVGDGEGGIDALESTNAAAEDVGFRVLASATITSAIAERTQRHRGKRRPEHAILLEAP